MSVAACRARLTLIIFKTSNQTGTPQTLWIQALNRLCGRVWVETTKFHQRHSHTNVSLTNCSYHPLRYPSTTLSTASQWQTVRSFFFRTETHTHTKTYNVKSRILVHILCLQNKYTNYYWPKTTKLKKFNPISVLLFWKIPLWQQKMHLKGK